MSSEMWTLAGSVILSGLVIVFLILIFLILCVNVTGKIINGGTKKSAAPVLEQRPQPVIRPLPAPAAVPVIEQGIAEETVAVISAAVFSCMDAAAPGVSYEIKSINRATGGRPVWGFAGMQQNTRPF